MVSEERRGVPPWAGALITSLLGFVSGAAIPWAVVIFFAVFPDADSFIVFLAMLMPFLAFVATTGSFGFLGMRYASRFGTSPLWPVGGGIAGIALQGFVLAEIIQWIANQE